MSFFLSCDAASKHAAFLSSTSHTLTTKFSVVNGSDAFLMYTYQNDIELKDIRFHNIWSYILTPFANVTNQQFDLGIRKVEEINWSETVNMPYLPPYSQVGQEASNYYAQQEVFQSHVILPNCMEENGLFKQRIYDYVTERTSKEIVPKFTIDPLKMLFSFRSFAAEFSTNDLRLIYDKVLSVWIPYMNEVGLVNGKYINPVRLKRGKLVRVGTDSYFVKRLSVTISYLFFSYSYVPFISPTSHEIFFEALYECFFHMFKSPFLGIGDLKDILTPILLNAGSIPRDKSDVAHMKEYFGAHYHPIYDTTANANRHRSNVKAYNPMNVCQNSNCGKDQQAFMIYNAIKKDVVTKSLKLCARLKLNNLLKAARILLTENYSEKGVRLLMYMHNAQSISGFRASCPIKDISDTVEKSNINRKKFDLSNPIQREFSQKLFALGKKLVRIQKRNDLIPDSVKFKKALPSYMTGRSAGKGGIKLKFDGIHGTFMAKDKRAYLVGKGMEILNLKSSELATSEHRDRTGRMNYLRIGLRNVSARKARAIYMKPIEWYIIECYLFTWIEYQMHPPLEVQDEAGDPHNLGTYNIKCRLDSSDEYVCEMVEATGNSGMYVMFMDQSQYDMSERVDNVLSHLFNGFLTEARETLSQVVTPFTLDGDPLTYPQLVELYIKYGLTQWYVLEYGKYAIQFNVDWLASGAKYTFDGNSDVNNELTTLLWDRLRVEFPGIKLSCRTIAGDDNVWVVSNFNTTEHACKRVLELMEEVTHGCGFTINIDKSGFSPVIGEFAKIVGYAGYSMRVGLMCPFERESVSEADNIIEALRGAYTKLQMFPLRHYFGEHFSDMLLYIMTPQYNLTSTDRARKTTTDIIPHAVFHGLPASTGLGLNFTYDLMSADTMQGMISEDRARAVIYYNISQSIKPFKPMEQPDLSKAVGTLVDGGITTKIDFAGNLTSIITLDSSLMNKSMYAEKTLRSIGVPVAAKGAYYKGAVEFKDILIESIRLLSPSTRTEVNPNSFMINSISTNDTFDETYPIFALVRSTKFSSRNLENEISHFPVIRYPSSHTFICKVQHIFGNRHGDRVIRVLSMFRAMRRAISNAKRDGVIVSSQLNEETLANTILKAVITHKGMTGSTRARRKREGTTKMTTTITERGVYDNNTGNLVTLRGNESIQALNVVTLILQLYMGGYSKLSDDASKIAHAINGIIIGEFAIAVTYGPYLYLDVQNDVLSCSGPLRSRNYKYYYQLTMLMYVISQLYFTDELHVPESCGLVIHKYYEDIVIAMGKRWDRGLEE